MYFFTLSILGVTSGSVPSVAAQEKQAAGLFAQVEPGRTFPVAVGIRNTCRKPHRFRIDNNAEYLRFTDQITSILVTPGVRKPMGAIFDGTGLENKVYQNTLIVKCLDCKKEKGCTQDKDEIPIQLTVSKPMIPAALPTTVSKTPVLNCCQCLGGSNSLDLSTVPGNKWVLNGQPVIFPTMLDLGWTLSPRPANWVSKSTDSLPIGIYDYKLQFVVPPCIIDQKVILSGNYGGDNNVQVYLDDTLLSQCKSGKCFSSVNPPPAIRNVTVVPGTHVLTVKVENLPYVPLDRTPSPSGMFINAKLVSYCASDNYSTGNDTGTNTKKF
jgi:hypothetical protein